MIRTFRHKGLRLLWGNNDASKLPADQVQKIMQLLQVIDNAQEVPQDFEFFKSWKIHSLK